MFVDQLNINPEDFADTTLQQRMTAFGGIAYARRR
jgi:hypothetical protein